MSRWRDLAGLVVGLVLAGGVARAAEAPKYGFGTTPTQAQIDGWAIAVRPDGQGLPAGHGTVAEGDPIYADNCAACHGTFGEGANGYPRLVGDGKLTGERPDPDIQTYWPYATTVFDYINRAMPFPAPHSLTPDQVYAVTAYLLNMSGLVADDFVADRTTLPKVKMPNVNGFIWKDPRPDTANTLCMSHCVAPDKVVITSTAAGKGLTPRLTGALDTALPQ
jgi:cytochrome c